MPLHYLWKLFGARSLWPQVFLGLCRPLLRAARSRIEGAPLAGDVLFVANHVSWLDILALGGASRRVFVASDEVERWPVIGWLAGLNDTIYVARDARQRGAGPGRRSFATALAAGRAGRALFPEGTTDGGRDVLPFRASLFASLFPPLPGVRVQPVAIDYGAAADDIAWVGDESARRQCQARSCRGPARSRSRFRFLAPIDPARGRRPQGARRPVARGDRRRRSALPPARRDPL